MDHAGRRDALRGALADREADAAVLAPGPNLQYFTGFRGEPGDRHTPLVVRRDGGALVVAAEAYAPQVRANADVGVRTVDGDAPEPVAAGVAAELGGADRVLLDGNARAAFARALDAALDGTVASADPATTARRITKDDAERGALRRAAGLADGVSTAVRARGADAVGTTERDLAREVRAELFEAGAEALSFPVVVGSGPTGAEPALRHGDREIRRGDPVVLDFGGVLAGYASDQTRTVVFAGDPPEGFVDAHDAVRAALDAGVAAAEPGVPASAVDRAAKGVLEERGYGDAIRHDTGHGVGLAAHEAPTVGPGSDRDLRPGMVFSVEPGVYLDGFGVRIEDLVLVTGSGAERLNDSPRGWRPTRG